MISESECYEILGFQKEWCWEYICRESEKYPKNIQKNILFYVIKRYLTEHDIKFSVSDVSFVSFVSFEGNKSRNKSQGKFIISQQQEHLISLKNLIMFPKPEVYYEINNLIVSFEYTDCLISKYLFLVKKFQDQYYYTEKKIIMRDYQSEALQDCLRSRCTKNIVIMPFASGKTLVQVMLAKQFNSVKIYVPNIIVQQQTERLFKQLKITGKIVQVYAFNNQDNLKKFDIVIYDDFENGYTDTDIADGKYYFTADPDNLPENLGKVIHETEITKVQSLIMDYNINCLNIQDLPEVINVPGKIYITGTETIYNLLLQKTQQKVYFIRANSSDKFMRCTIQEFKDTGGILCCEKYLPGINIPEIQM